MRLKIIAATGTAERRFSSWIGGSILASLVCNHNTPISLSLSLINCSFSFYYINFHTFLMLKKYLPGFIFVHAKMWGILKILSKLETNLWISLAIYFFLLEHEMNFNSVVLIVENQKLLKSWEWALNLLLKKFNSDKIFTNL